LRLEKRGLLKREAGEWTLSPAGSAAAAKLEKENTDVC